jgi:hypothetical protein
VDTAQPILQIAALFPHVDLQRLTPFAGFG